MADPSYTDGYAPRDGPPLFPELQETLNHAFVPALGNTGAVLRDVIGGADGDIDPTFPVENAWVDTDRGLAIRSRTNSADRFIVPEAGLTAAANYTVAAVIRQEETGNDKPVFGQAAAGPNNNASVYYSLTRTYHNSATGTGRNAQWPSVDGWRLFSWRHDGTNVTQGNDDAFSTPSATDAIDFTAIRAIFGSGNFNAAMGGDCLALYFYGSVLTDAQLAAIQADHFAPVRLAAKFKPLGGEVGAWIPTISGDTDAGENV